MPWQLLIYLVLPLAAIVACHKNAALNKVGVVLICYAAGIALGSLGFFPEAAQGYQEQVAGAAVAFALPLLLFTLDVRRWFALAGKALLSMAAACAATVVMAMVGSILLRAMTADSWQLGGMAAGVYTGGTPNVAAIRTALGVDMSTFVVFHTYDTVVSVLYIVFCMTAARRFFGLWLEPFAAVAPDDMAVEQEEEETESVAAFTGLLRFRVWPRLLLLSLLSGAIVAASAYVGGLFPYHASSAATIVFITSLGIAASFLTPVRETQYAFQWGMYVIYVFCCVVGSMVDASILTRIHYPALFMVTLVIFGGMGLHALLCRFLRIDTDTFIITSVSAICSPPFVPPIAEALHNKHVLLSGITTGIIGYGLGNYLGIFVAFLMRMLLT